MNARLLIHVVGQSSRTAPLGQRRLVVGSEAQAEVCIDHAEIGPRAAAIEWRGGDYWVQNLNPFVVYLGNQALRPNGTAAWPDGAKLQLTRSVALELQAGDAQAGGTSRIAGGAGARDVTRNVTQLVVIAASVALIAFLLLRPQDRPQRGQQDRIAAMLAEFDRAPPAGSREALAQLRARLSASLEAERRWSEQEPRKAMAAYQSLLRLESIRRPNSPLAERIGRLATERIADLSAEFE